MYELQSIFGGDCTKDADISNAASTWVGLAAGIIIGAIITWWVYNRQKKTSYMQDKLLEQIVALEKKILSLEEKIEFILENRK
jgi:Na+/glutamate symporter